MEWLGGRRIDVRVQIWSSSRFSSISGMTADWEEVITIRLIAGYLRADLRMLSVALMAGWMISAS